MPAMTINRWLAVRLEFLGSCLMFSTALTSVSALLLSNSVDAGLVGLMMTYTISVTGVLVSLSRITRANDRTGLFDRHLKWSRTSFRSSVYLDTQISYQKPQHTFRKRSLSKVGHTKGISPLSRSHLHVQRLMTVISACDTDPNSNSVYGKYRFRSKEENELE